MTGATKESDDSRINSVSGRQVQYIRFNQIQ